MAAQAAIVRPYSTRAVRCPLSGGRFRNPADCILEAFALAWGVDNGMQYDIFELPPKGAEAPRPDNEALSRYPLVVSTIPIPGLSNVRVLGEGTEGTTLTAAELAAMRRAFAAETAGWSAGQ